MRKKMVNMLIAAAVSICMAPHGKRSYLGKRWKGLVVSGR